MKFLADESCDFIVVRVLRKAGYDVQAISEISPALDDDKVIEMAIREERVLLTEDKDFGQLAMAHSESHFGVILLRFPASARTSIPVIALEFISHQKDLRGSFVVVQPGRIRITKSGA